jgi:hypothetical protein
MDVDRTISTGSIRVHGVIVSNEQAAGTAITVDFTNVANDFTYMTIVCDGVDSEHGFSSPFIADQGGFVARPSNNANAAAFVSVEFSQDGA